ncbi:MAG TPA: flavin reductase family protein [Candidatus Fraserbacteria bacterium]|nr:flavin reductase family protein [Candidatus Fraserbacteria bacterium]
MKVKVSLGLNKRTWHPSPLVGQIVLVTTLNEDGTSNIAPKSWISMMTFEPPILAIGCDLQHRTARNILRDKEFVVNVPGAELAEIVWESSELPHPRPVEAVGLTPIPALKVKPPRIEECKAHLECALDRHLTYEDEVILLGQIVATSVDQEVHVAKDPYEYLRMFVYLEGNTYGVIEQAWQLGDEKH